MRCFVAIDLDDRIRDAVRVLRDRLGPGSIGWRFLDPERVHLTLRFLGETDPQRIPALSGDLARACALATPATVHLGRLGTFPPRGVARILWVDAADAEPAGALDDLAARVGRVAESHGWPAETRRFRPHLTVARARRGSRPDRPPAGERVEAAPMRVDAVVLYESVLRPEGARYRELDRFQLGGGS